MSKGTRNLIVFFVATFALTWVCYFAIVAAGASPYQMPWMLVFLLGGGAPSVVGILMVFRTYDREQRRDYWKRCISFRRIRPLWWLIIFAVPALLMLASVSLSRLLGDQPPGMLQWNQLVANPAGWPLAILMGLASGPLAEEFGWRGYSLDPLLRRLGVIRASLVLGVIWCVWHLPMFWMPDTWRGQIGWGLYGFWTNLIYTVGLAAVMTWVYLNTNRSILSAFLMHFTSNFAVNLIYPVSDNVHLIDACLFLLLGAAVCVWMVQRGGKTVALAGLPAE